MMGWSFGSTTIFLAGEFDVKIREGGKRTTADEKNECEFRMASTPRVRATVQKEDF